MLIIHSLLQMVIQQAQLTLALTSEPQSMELEPG